jgi:voltage-gated potassium channel
MTAPTTALDRKIVDIVARHPREVAIAKFALGVAASAISPTWRLAAWLKPPDPERRTYVIVGLNVVYLVIAVATITILIVRFDNNARPLLAGAWSPLWIWGWFLWSRCAEVFIAFYRDAVDQLKDKPAGSDLTAAWRVRLALNSYVELIIDYAMLYALLPISVWQSSPTTITDFLWLSASTITTSGSAGYVLTGRAPQLLSTFEIVGGIILLVVCFALYSGGRADERRAAPLRQPPAA